MIELLDDSTIYMNEVNKLIGSETSVAERVRKHRENNKLLQCNIDVTNCNTEKEIELEIDIEKDLEKEKEIIMEEEKKVATPFSQTLILKLFQFKFINDLNEYDDYIDLIERLKEKYNESNVENAINELINDDESKIKKDNRLSYLEKFIIEHCERTSNLPF